MIIFTIVSFCFLIGILLIILFATLTSDNDYIKTDIIAFVLLVVLPLIYIFVIPPFDEWSAKRYDEAIENVKIAREKYNPEVACKNDSTNYCLVINKKKLENAIDDSITAFRDYKVWSAE